MWWLRRDQVSWTENLSRFHHEQIELLLGKRFPYFVNMETPVLSAHFAHSVKLAMSVHWEGSISGLSIAIRMNVSATGLQWLDHLSRESSTHLPSVHESQSYVSAAKHDRPDMWNASAHHWHGTHIQTYIHTHRQPAHNIGHLTFSSIIGLDWNFTENYGMQPTQYFFTRRQKIQFDGHNTLLLSSV